MRISDWSSDVCSSDLLLRNGVPVPAAQFYTVSTAAQVVGVVATGGVLTGKALSASQAMGNGDNRFVVQLNGETSFAVIVDTANKRSVEMRREHSREGVWQYGETTVWDDQ